MNYIPHNDGVENLKYKIRLEKEKYHKAMEHDMEFQEAKKIYVRIKKLERELENLLDKQNKS